MAGLENALSTIGWPESEVAGCRALVAVWLETGASNDPHQDCPTAAQIKAVGGEEVHGVHDRDRSA